jgi:hypothetical protein
MFSYLNTCYPDAYLVKTKFGHVLYNKDGATEDVIVMKISVVKKLVDLFCCHQNDATRNFNIWYYSRPAFEKVTNSTNETIFVPVKVESNPTF